MHSSNTAVSAPSPAGSASRPPSRSTTSYPVVPSIGDAAGSTSSDVKISRPRSTPPAPARAAARGRSASSNPSTWSTRSPSTAPSWTSARTRAARLEHVEVLGAHRDEHRDVEEPAVRQLAARDAPVGEPVRLGLEHAVERHWVGVHGGELVGERGRARGALAQGREPLGEHELGAMPAPPGLGQGGNGRGRCPRFLSRMPSGAKQLRGLGASPWGGSPASVSPMTQLGVANPLARPPDDGAERTRRERQLGLAAYAELPVALVHDPDRAGVQGPAVALAEHGQEHAIGLAAAPVDVE